MFSRGLNPLAIESIHYTAHKASGKEKLYADFEEDKNDIQKWPKSTILIATDSMFNQIDEKRLSTNYNVKVGGATVKNMYWYLHPLLAKEPDYLILHVGTNNCTTNTADEILVELLKLKQHIEKTLPRCTVILSQPIIRNDIQRATKTMNEFISKFNQFDMLKLDNSNIVGEQLGRKGLHLNYHGTRRLAMNIISLIRGL